MSVLARLHGTTAAAAPELRAMAAAAWHKREVACFLDLAEIADPWVREIVRNEANRQFGRRDATKAGGCHGS